MHDARGGGIDQVISQGGASEEFIDNLPKVDDKAAAALEQGDGTSALRNAGT